MLGSNLNWLHLIDVGKYFSLYVCRKLEDVVSKLWLLGSPKPLIMTFRYLSWLVNSLTVACTGHLIPQICLHSQLCLLHDRSLTGPLALTLLLKRLNVLLMQRMLKLKVVRIVLDLWSWWAAIVVSSCFLLKTSSVACACMHSVALRSPHT